MLVSIKFKFRTTQSNFELNSFSKRFYLIYEGESNINPFSLDRLGPEINRNSYKIKCIKLGL